MRQEWANLVDAWVVHIYAPTLMPASVTAPALSAMA
jgi:hypothetical protein